RENLEQDLAQRVDWVLGRAQKTVPNDTHMSEHISNSVFVELVKDPEYVARQMRRSKIQRQTAAARESNLVHDWIEQFYARNMPGFTPSFDIEETEQLVDADWDQATGLAELRERFQASQWAQRVPVMIEAAVETSVLG